MHGFTLAELMVVIAIVGILSAVALPNLRDLIVTQGIKNASFDVFASLVFARNEAITRGATVTITPAGGNWALGWTVTAANGDVVRQQNAYPTTLQMSGPASVAYNAMGRLNGVAGTISLTAADASASNSRCIRIDLSGRPVTKKGTC